MGIKFTSTGNDPHFVLPKLKILSGEIILKIDLTAPIATKLQLFYKTKLLQSFNELRFVIKSISSGRSTISIKIPTNKIKGRLRLDPGSHPGSYILHKIELVGYTSYKHLIKQKRNTQYKNGF